MDLDRFINLIEDRFGLTSSITLCCSASGYQGETARMYEVVTSQASCISWINPEDTVFAMSALAVVGELVSVTSIVIKLYCGIPIDSLEVTSMAMGLPATCLFVCQIPVYIRLRRNRR